MKTEEERVLNEPKSRTDGEDGAEGRSKKATPVSNTFIRAIFQLSHLAGSLTH